MSWTLSLDMLVSACRAIRNSHHLLHALVMLVSLCLCSSQCDHVADVNECNQSPCGHASTCVNTPGSFQCLCNAGYVGDGTSCYSKGKEYDVYS